MTTETAKATLPAPYYEHGGITVYHGDSLKILPLLELESFTAVVTDPPYGIGFMGKEFDTFKPEVVRQEMIRDTRTQKRRELYGGRESDAPSAAMAAGRYDRSTSANQAFQAWCTQWAALLLPVCKPGAPLLAFGGTRTSHRLVCAIEDAGWEVRDSLMWIFGCLSEDTEVLTPDGWEHYNTANGKAILTYDVQTDVFAWEVPQRWSTYCVKSDTAYRIQSDSTDQIVSRNHRCLVERGRSLTFVAAEKCSGVERVPTLSDDLHWLPQTQAAVLQRDVQRLLSRARLGQARAQRGVGCFAGRAGISCSEDDGFLQSGMERWANLFQEKGQVCRPVNQVHSMPAGVCVDGPEGRLCDGASPAGGKGNRTAIDPEGMCSSCEPRCNGQPDRKPSAVCLKCRPQTARTRTSYRATLATVTPFSYTGVIFCPTVSTGAFVARRNGKIFVTGNSGFPKSLSISKAIDKAAGAEREIVGSRPAFPDGTRGATYHGDKKGGAIGNFASCETIENGMVPILAPATEAAKLWDGWQTALKPAYEPICLAMKPLAGTFAQNAIEHGVAGINVDGCRIGTEMMVNSPAGSAGDVMKTGLKPNAPPTTSSGRWPANLLLQHHPECVQVGIKKVKGSPRVSGNEPSLPNDGTKTMGKFTSRLPYEPYTDADGFEIVEAWNCHPECPIRILDEQSGVSKSSVYAKSGTRNAKGPSRAFGNFDQSTKNAPDNYGDTGGASRFFKTFPPDACRFQYVAKASKSDRGHAPEEDLPLFGETVPEFRNTHPTVKPIALMEYLCRLVMPPANGLILDPFAGSGTTGIACKRLGVRAILIEENEEYCEIIAERLRNEH